MQQRSAKRAKILNLSTGKNSKDEFFINKLLKNYIY